MPCMDNNKELILISISGVDKPGITASITEILSKYNVTVLDIGQADIHNTLSLGILFKTDEKNSGTVMKDLLFSASSLGINIRFYPVTDRKSTRLTSSHQISSYAVFCLKKKKMSKWRRRGKTSWTGREPGLLQGPEE